MLELLLGAVLKHRWALRGVVLGGGVLLGAVLLGVLGRPWPHAAPGTHLPPHTCPHRSTQNFFLSLKANQGSSAAAGGNGGGAGSEPQSPAAGQAAASPGRSLSLELLTESPKPRGLLGAMLAGPIEAMLLTGWVARRCSRLPAPDAVRPRGTPTGRWRCGGCCY